MVLNSSKRNTIIGHNYNKLQQKKMLQFIIITTNYGIVTTPLFTTLFIQSKKVIITVLGQTILLIFLNYLF